VPNGRLLGIYLNDHLAGATVGVELVRRARRSNRGTELGRFLDGLQIEVEEDRRTLEDVIRQLGFRPSTAKRAAAVVAERAGRLKPNGQITGYSPLSRVLELEGLTVGVAGKRSLWRNLRDAAGTADRLVGVDLDRLLERAEDQLAGIEGHRVEAARRAFAAESESR
jgi:sulfur carrier protein ThiS